MKLWIVRSGEFRRGHVNGVLVRAPSRDEAVAMAIEYAKENDAFKQEPPMPNPSVEEVEAVGETDVLLVDEEGGW